MVQIPGVICALSYR